MMMHPGETRLNDYLDEGLDDDAEAALVEHLSECASCRAELAQLRGIVDAAAGLFDAIEPRHDLWPAIDARIDTEGIVDLDAWRARSGSRLWSHRYQLAAAATLLVLAASTGTLLLVRDSGRSAPVAATPAPESSPVRLVSVPGQADYLAAIRELDALLRSRASQMDPQTAEVVRENMAIIDQAIRETHAALAADPANGDLNRAVTTAYKTKIKLLRRAVELPVRT
ncbi:MAG TPA: zf-HC2 domain-containing protein [Longimicrobiales bacterium]|nr:zf-HC2 domain-containing protein [Longimicrobiales bacterium]